VRLPEPAEERPRAGVSVGPGETAFTRTPAGETSRASDFVSAITPPFAAA
jgi:hypothetical protein